MPDAVLAILCAQTILILITTFLESSFFSRRLEVPEGQGFFVLLFIAASLVSRTGPGIE